MPDWECIVVDDSPGERVAATLYEATAGDGRFRFIHLDHASSDVLKWNSALPSARGYFFKPVLAGSQLDPSALVVQVRAAAGVRDVDVVAAGLSGQPLVLRGPAARAALWAALPSAEQLLMRTQALQTAGGLTQSHGFVAPLVAALELVGTLVPVADRGVPSVAGPTWRQWRHRRRMSAALDAALGSVAPR
jgi:hypothetical protein